ncbi:MAG TPA: hypothetical protein VFX14_18480 [Methylomirabilota bacterium]|nr:hypothetical protein [Methylomirabilota bacterium]
MKPVPVPSFGPRVVARRLLLALAALAQLGCQSVGYLPAGQGQILLEGVTMEPDFVTSRASLPAVVRYWTAEDPHVTVRWQKITTGPACDLCAVPNRCGEDERSGVLTALPEVAVTRRALMSRDFEPVTRFPYASGCRDQAAAVFLPPVTASYFASLQFPDSAALVPSMDDAGTLIQVQPGGVTLPLRRLIRVPDTSTWTWREPARDGRIKEAFDPRLHVAQVRVFQATCTGLHNGVGPDPDGDECAGNVPMDAMFRVVKPLSVRAGDAEGTRRTCEADALADDGDIDFGMERVSSAGLRCRPEDRATFFTPAYRVNETEAGAATMPWTVELSPEVVAQLPEAVQQQNGNTWLWVQFTLKRSP